MTDDLGKWENPDPEVVFPPQPGTLEDWLRELGTT